MKKEIYLDHAAFTPASPLVIKEVKRGLEIVGNPSSFNDSGRRAALELARARKTVANFLGVRVEEIIFAGSGSEANTLAILGVLGAHQNKKSWKLLISAIEHESVLRAADRAKTLGAQVEMLPVDSIGKVSVDAVAQKIDKKTLLVSVMYANNEIGTIQEIKNIGQKITDMRRRNHTPYPYFHVDACQAASHLDMNAQNLHVDLLTFNGTKIYGPSGVAALYVRRSVPIQGQILGGKQELGRRAGTENLPGILGLAQAVKLISTKESARLRTLRDYFFKKIPSVLPKAHIVGSLGDQRIPNNIHITVAGCDSENLLLELDKHGIQAGSGSACTAFSVEPSHVLVAIGLDRRYQRGALRFSLGRATTRKDINYLLKVLPKAVATVRKRYHQT